MSRQIRHAENARFLRRMPGFTLDQSVPQEIETLLGKLQEVEEGTSERRGKQNLT
ncbi:hypothetical protein [Nitratireductor basaltis]|uniref:hypothetical protein n=1 Tax=Nitratireductor basaltis TaxID=472175 RepID=UPI000AFA9163|nr:hypothetical protein [Nitratireductor basaltis]